MVQGAVKRLYGSDVAGFTHNDSIFIGMPAAMFLMNKWLEHFAYRITLHWWMPVATAAAVIIVALVTEGSKAMFTAMAKPARHLRNE